MITLQNFIFPETGICTEVGLYFHLNREVTTSPASGELHFLPGGTAGFGTYFNALSIGKWHNDCELNGLWLEICGSGTFEIKVIQADPDKSHEVILWDILKLTPEGRLLDLSQYGEGHQKGLIFLELTATSKGKLSGARFLTATKKPEMPRLVVSITTFKREAEVEGTAARLKQYLAKSEFGGQIDVLVVDNGQSANISQSKHVRYVENANLGGAGGFARGLLEAETAGYSHCLFMDDDASFHMENLHRTFVYLSLARDPKTAVAGAMINNTHKWSMWENGAIFDRSCRPVSCGTDLRDLNQLQKMEIASVGAKPPNFYGGWWYFAFPIEQVEHYPFPFFVRGDDINFSLSNDFNIQTLNGVVSFQDDFSDKESPQTLYLDLRNHLVQHLTVETIQLSALKSLRILFWFVLRNAVKFQYETCDVLLLACQDVMRGPDFFTEHADMSVRRGTLKNMVDQEAWKPIADLDIRERLVFDPTRIRFLPFRPLWRITFNGHLLPFFGAVANHVLVPPMQRSGYEMVWASSQITYLNTTREKGYTVTLSRRRFAGVMIRTLWTGLRFVMSYKTLQREYRQAHGEMTSPTYWHRLLGNPLAK